MGTLKQLPPQSGRDLDAVRLSGELVLTSEQRARDAMAVNTLNIYKKLLLRFRQSGYMIPATPVEVAQFLENVRQPDGTPYSIATIKMFRAAIAYAHHDARQPDPCLDIEVKRSIQGIINRRKANGGKGIAQREARPILKEEAYAMVTARMKHGNPTKSARDKALIIFGRSLAGRRSELLALRVEDLMFVTGGMVVTIRWSKTDQAAVGDRVYIPSIGGLFCPVRAMKDWLATGEITSGYIFRGVDRNGVVSDRPIAHRSLALILKKRARAAGLDDEFISGHSLRAGFATSAALAGVPEHRIKAHGRWKSDVWRKYVRDPLGLDEDNPIRQIW